MCSIMGEYATQAGQRTFVSVCVDRRELVKNGVLDNDVLLVGSSVLLGLERPIGQ